MAFTGPAPWHEDDTLPSELDDLFQELSHAELSDSMKNLADSLHSHGYHGTLNSWQIATTFTVAEMQILRTSLANLRENLLRLDMSTDIAQADPRLALGWAVKDYNVLVKIIALGVTFDPDDPE
jgi:hypothetical protein